MDLVGENSNNSLIAGKDIISDSNRDLAIDIIVVFIRNFASRRTGYARSTCRVDGAFENIQLILEKLNIIWYFNAMFSSNFFCLF